MLIAMETIIGIDGLRAKLASRRRQGARIGLVPTMGALHDGHLSLVRETQKRSDHVVVSIFVNPAQFAPHEDFDRYPRNLDVDRAKLSTVGVDLVFAPDVAEIYPTGFSTRVEVSGPARGLETDFRPHFFSGVATVVAKLLIAVMPDLATFGEKDYQQLLVVRRLAHDLGLPVEIFGVPIVREGDGLAMSSRNAYLSQTDRAIAGKLNVILKEAISHLRHGASLSSTEEFAINALREAGFSDVDYVAIRDAETLAHMETLLRPARILAAVRVAGTRLIDNMAIELHPH